MDTGSEIGKQNEKEDKYASSNCPMRLFRKKSRATLEMCNLETRLGYWVCRWCPEVCCGVNVIKSLYRHIYCNYKSSSHTAFPQSQSDLMAQLHSKVGRIMSLSKDIQDLTLKGLASGAPQWGCLERKENDQGHWVLSPVGLPEISCVLIWRLGSFWGPPLHSSMVYCPLTFTD